MNLLETARQYVNGVSILKDWLDAGGITVDKELAQSRANICLKCPKHNDNWSIVESVAVEIRKQVGLKNHLNLKISGEKQLHICGACQCVLKLKVWLPLANILPEPEERDKFDKSCWLLLEKP